MSTKRGYKRSLRDQVVAPSPLNTTYTTVDLPQELLKKTRRFPPKTSRMQVHTPEELRAIKLEKAVKAVKARILARAEEEILRRVSLVSSALDGLITPYTLPSQVESLAVEAAEQVRDDIFGDVLDSRYISDEDFDTRLQEIELYDLCSYSDEEGR